MGASGMIRHRPWEAPPHDFSIGLKPVPEALWLEGGDAEAERKATLLAAHKRMVWGELDGSRPGQEEVLALVEDAVMQTAPSDMPPLWAASLFCADDLCLMEKRNGAWTLTALSLCSPTYFTAEEDLGKDLSALHGPVPGFGDRFLSRVSRIFDSLPENSIVERRNWTVTTSDEAYLPSSEPIRRSLADIPKEDAGERLFIRVERQTLRRLPKTGGVLFTIRPWRNRLADLSEDPEALQAFAAAWRGATEDFRAYKGLASYDSHIEAFLASH